MREFTEHSKKSYTQGCRCTECKKANAASQRDYQHRKKAGLVIPRVKKILGGAK